MEVGHTTFVQAIFMHLDLLLVSDSRSEITAQILQYVQLARLGVKSEYDRDGFAEWSCLHERGDVLGLPRGTHAKRCDVTHRDILSSALFQSLLVY